MKFIFSVFKQSAVFEKNNFDLGVESKHNVFFFKFIFRSYKKF